jgi:hypothetical protein
MSEKRLTPWFPPSIVPARPGIYETRWVPEARRASHVQYQHWNGTFWGAWHIDINGAAANADGASSRQEPEWRGLAEPPK